jgi:hypothetical protein
MNPDFAPVKFVFPLETRHARIAMTTGDSKEQAFSWIRVLERREYLL